MTDRICNIRESVASKTPLIHCITNPISINQCANAILSVGAKPIMAEHPKEVCEITGESDALMLNIGNITDVRMESIMLSMRKAEEKSVPVLLDVVGIACSRLRRKYVIGLFEISVPSVVKGNYSEIMALYAEEYFSSGVDADNSLDISCVEKATRELAIKYKTTVLATGKIDIITDGKRIAYVKNGTSQLATVTGTGCMLGALCTTFMSVYSPIDATISACCYFGICGELAKTDSGSGSFMMNLMDKISTLDREEIKKNINLEEW